MLSAFAKPRKIISTSKNSIDETYDLRGLNLVSPDNIMPKGESPYTINSRMYAREDDSSSVANRTRHGSSRLSVPIGETADVANTATATGDVSFSTSVTVAQPFVPTTTARLTKLELEVKQLLNATGHVLIEIRADNSGTPSETVITQSAILSQNITTSYGYKAAYFIDAPTLTSGTTYWMVVYTQNNGTGTYALHKTAASGALQKAVTSSGESWTVLGYTFRYKTYLSTDGAVLGHGTRYPSSGSKLILFAHGTNVYSTPKGTGITTSIDSSLSASATKYRFIQIDDDNYWVNGYDKVRKWTGTGTAANLTGSPNAPKNILLAHNRMFLQTGNTRVDFSELSDFTTWPADNFFYVPTALSPDPMTAWCLFKGDIWIYTHETKHRITGTSITTFTRRELTGTHGCISQEALAVDDDYMYFMADDGQIYRSNGVGDDQLVSDKMQPEFQGVTDKTKVSLHLYKNQLRVYYPKTPTTYANRMALYDIPLKQWFLDTGRPVTGSMELYLDNNEIVEFSSLVGAIYLGEDGFSDLGKKIDWKYWTPYKTYGSGSAKKRIKKFRPVIRTVDANFTMYVGKDLDFANRPDMREYIVAGGGATWGHFVWGDGTRWGSVSLIDTPAAMSGRGKHVQYRFEHAGVETPVELYGYISQYKIGNPK